MSGRDAIDLEETMRVGICGFATSGKDVAASALVDERGFVRVNMSDALRRDMIILDPFIGPEGVRLSDALRVMSYDSVKHKFPEFRRLLQIYGTDVWRSIDPDTWVRRAATESARHERVVTTGIRFLNELDGIDVLVHVVRPGVGPVNAHPSDAGIGEVARLAAVTLQNDGSPEQLRQRMLAWADQHLGLVRLGG